MATSQYILDIILSALESEFNATYERKGKTEAQITIDDKQFVIIIGQRRLPPLVRKAWE